MIEGIGEGRQPEVGALLHDIGKDLRVIAIDELELMRRRLIASTREFAVDALCATLAAVAALIGLGLLCTAAVAGLASAIPQLWLRLVLMAVVYVATGGGFAYLFGARLRAHARAVAEPAREVKDTFAAVSAGLEH